MFFNIFKISRQMRTKTQSVAFFFRYEIPFCRVPEISFSGEKNSGRKKKKACPHFPVLGGKKNKIFWKKSITYKGGKIFALRALYIFFCALKKCIRLCMYCVSRPSVQLCRRMYILCTFTVIIYILFDNSNTKYKQS